MFLRKSLQIVAILAVCLVGTSSIRAQSAVDVHEEIKSLYYDLHDRIEFDTTGGAVLHDEVIEVLETIMADQPETLHGTGLLAAMEVANRLETRKGLLDRISNVAYGHDFQTKYDTVHANWVFCLGIIEHSRGDMEAARMWFDSTLTFLDQGLKHESIAAAAKLLGFIERAEGNYSEATEKFEIARKLFSEWGARPSESIDIASAWASSAIRSGADPIECLRVSQNAVDRLDADSLLLKRWTYAYIVYLNHAQVLTTLGRYKDAEKYAKHAVDFCAGRGDVGSRAYVLLQMAKMQIDAGRYRSAKVALEESLLVFERTGHLDHQVEAYLYLEEIYEKEGNYKKSLEHSRKGRHTSLLLAESTRAEQLIAARKNFGIAEAESKTLLAEEIATRAKLERQKAKSNQFLLLVGILCIAMLLAFSVYRLRSRSQRQGILEKEVASRTAELAAKTKRLEASNQELEKFAYIASHDMKTPLRNVTSFLGLIERRMPENAKPLIGEYIQLAQSYATSMHSLVTDVLEFSKLNVDVSSLSNTFSLRALCEELIADRRQDLAGSGAKVEVLGGASLHAPPAFIGQVIGNLIDNGLKYNKSVIPRVYIKLIDGENEVRIIVSDNGIGIAEKYQDKIFELFKRLHTSDQYAGTGLGLASSKKIVERLGGTLSLKSEVGKGSNFMVVLPKVFRGESKSETIGLVDLSKSHADDHASARY